MYTCSLQSVPLYYASIKPIHQSTISSDSWPSKWRVCFCFHFSCFDYGDSAARISPRSSSVQKHKVHTLPTQHLEFNIFTVGCFSRTLLVFIQINYYSASSKTPEQNKKQTPSKTTTHKTPTPFTVEVEKHKSDTSTTLNSQTFTFIRKALRQGHNPTLTLTFHFHGFL